MHVHRVVIQRLPEGSVPPCADELRRIAPPELADLRLVFGVGSGPEAAPTVDEFHPVYTVSMPVFSPAGLDPDGVYEFDAGAQLELLRSRATRREWGLRLELEIVQPSEALNAAELYIDTPWEGGLARPMLLGPARGEPLRGGGRSFVLASSPVCEVEQARALGGKFSMQLRDADPHGGGAATVESAVFEVHVDLHCYEFEAEEHR